MILNKPYDSPASPFVKLTFVPHQPTPEGLIPQGCQGDSLLLILGHQHSKLYEGTAVYNSVSISLIICEGDRSVDCLGGFSPSLWIMPPYKQDLTHAKQQTESTVVYTIIIYFHILI